MKTTTPERTRTSPEQAQPDTDANATRTSIAPVAPERNALKSTETARQTEDSYEAITLRFAKTLATVAILCGALFLFAVTAQASTYVVTNTNNSGPGSLREKIAAANADPFSTINFNIPGAGVHTILLDLQLILNQPVTINGYSQPGASANTQVNGSNALPLIELKSANPGFNTAFFINVSDCVIRGLVINNFDVGISINGTIQPGAFHTTITGCFIGTNAAGNLAAPNTYGILVNGSSDNIIGGVSLSARNLISGNTKSGISMSVADGKDSKNNLVAGNLIGTDKSGTGAIGNGNGIFLYQVNGPNTIGAAPPLARNVISGNVLSGISLSDALNTLVIGNYIGTNAAGTGKVGNGYGVFLAGMSVSNKIGTSGAGNLISGNTTDGIRFGNCVGDFCPVDNQVAGNLIGTGADGTSALGNTATGIFMEQAGTLKNTIGGTASDSANVIAFNGAGVISSAGRGNAILRNSIFSNTGPGIDLKGITGPNANDLNDLDTGPNNLQNFPVIASAVSSNGITTLSGTLNSEDNKSYRIEFFANQQCDASGFGEGTTFLSATNVVTSGHNASFSVSFLGFNLNQFITATATDPDGNTSEFSQCRQVTAPSPGNLQFSVGSSYFVSESDGALTVNITRTNGSAGAVTVNYATSNGSATAGSDYTAVSGTLQFGDGVTGQSFNVPITDDSVAEGTENVILTLSNPTGGALLGNPVSVGMWISDDDPDPKVSINDVSIAEGNSGATNANFTVSLSNPSGFQITVDFATMAGGTATPGNDYQSAGGTLTFAPGETSKLATVIVNGDAQQEPNETFVVHLANVWYAGLGDAQGIGTIIDDDAAPTISISDISLGEGNGGTTSFDFSVSLSAASGQTVTVDFATAGGTATSGVDFQPANNTLTFNPGETSKTITVMVNGDPANEPDETFFVNLSNPINTAIIKTQGVGTIKNDDAPQSAGSLDFSAQTYSVNENGASAVINVKRTGGSSGAVSVQYVTGGGTATDGSDYTSAGGTLNWADGDSSDKSFSLAILEDALNEPGETVSLSLSGPTGGAALGNQSTAVLTIADNDSQPGLSISDASLAEGNSGTTGFNINVTLSAASGQTVNVDYLTADGTALVGGDYQSTGGTLTFAPGETSKTVSVLVNGDTQNELDETFFVNLSNPVNATALKSQGKATVVNDDNASPLQTVQFSEASYSAQEDLGALTITVTRSGDASAAASVDYSTMDDKALQKNDYEFAAGTLNFAPGETSKTVTILLNEDAYLDGNETFNVVLSQPLGASLGQISTTVVTIIDDMAEPFTNPIDDAESFVYMHYHDFLNREPDAAGLQFWTNQITSCGNDAKCIEERRIGVSASFFLSIEFQETSYLRFLLERESFGATPKYTEFMRDVQELSSGVIVNSPGWEQKLKDNQQQFAEKWVNRPAFKAAYDGMSNTDFVNALYANAGILPTQVERESMVNALDGGNQSRSAVVLEVAANESFRHKEHSAAFVMMQYFGYLRRDPNAAPDSDMSGYNFWLMKLNQFDGNYINAEMIKAFITSFEYRGRFAQ